jgi:hypothetical protein
MDGKVLHSGYDVAKEDVGVLGKSVGIAGGDTSLLQLPCASYLFVLRPTRFTRSRYAGQQQTWLAVVWLLEGLCWWTGIELLVVLFFCQACIVQMTRLCVSWFVHIIPPCSRRPTAYSLLVSHILLTHSFAL